MQFMFSGIYTTLPKLLPKSSEKTYPWTLYAGKLLIIFSEGFFFVKKRFALQIPFFSKRTYVRKEILFLKGAISGTHRYISATFILHWEQRKVSTGSIYSIKNRRRTPQPNFFQTRTNSAEKKFLLYLYGSEQKIELCNSYSCRIASILLYQFEQQNWSNWAALYEQSGWNNIMQNCSPQRGWERP